MSKNAKRAYVSLLSLLGLVFLLLGIFVWTFSLTLGLILAIVCWVGSGILAKYWGVKKEKDERLHNLIVASTTILIHASLSLPT